MSRSITTQPCRSWMADMAKKFSSPEERRLYNRRHYMIVKERGRADGHGCISCPERAAEWATVHGTTGDFPEDYQPMCRPCHHKYDDRWNDDERARVAESTRKVWANSPDRKQSMIDYPHRLRAIPGGDA